jgi:hypothetical protein
MNTTSSIVVADWLQARVQFSFLILIARFLPARLADNISLVVTNVPIGVLQVFRFAWMVVNIQGSEMKASSNV